MDTNTIKLHFKCTNFNSSTRVTVYAECICVFLPKIVSSSLNTMLIVDTHWSDFFCYEFPVPQIERNVKQR